MIARRRNMSLKTAFVGFGGCGRRSSPRCESVLFWGVPMLCTYSKALPTAQVSRAIVYTHLQMHTKDAAKPYASLHFNPIKAHKG